MGLKLSLWAQKEVYGTEISVTSTLTSVNQAIFLLNYLNAQ